MQDELRPILLRRMKEDVETLPEKEEVIIWTEMTTFQRSYYKALYENQIATLLKGASQQALPNMRNLAMELRKVCCHPFLCNGLEDDLRMRMRTLNGTDPSDIDLLEAASGKLSLLSKLLPKLRGEGRKVLIFSQFKIMLNVIEDYVNLHRMPYERIDGDTDGVNLCHVACNACSLGSADLFSCLDSRCATQSVC
jgi:SNF2 family DNA or RNA helicase